MLKWLDIKNLVETFLRSFLGEGREILPMFSVQITYNLEAATRGVL